MVSAERVRTPEDQRILIGNKLLLEAKEVNRTLQQRGLSEKKFGKDSLTKVRSIVHKDQDEVTRTETLLLGTAATSHLAEKPTYEGLPSPARQYGFYLLDKEGSLHQVTDPAIMARFVDEGAGYHFALDMSYALGQNAGISPHVEEAFAINKYSPLSMRKVLGNTGMHVQYAFVKPIRPKSVASGVGASSREMVKMLEDPGVEEADIATLMQMDSFRRELGRYNHYDQRSPRLVAVRVQSLAWVNGEIDIPASRIHFAWKNPKGSRNDEKLFFSYLGLEDSSEQKTANLLFDMLKSNRGHRVDRAFERTEKTILGSLVVRVEGRRVHLLTRDGKELRNPVALAVYMKEHQLDVTGIYSGTIAELYTKLSS